MTSPATRAKSLSELASAGMIDPGWATALFPVAEKIAALGDFLRAENASGRGYLPAGSQILRAFSYPHDAVRVLIVGQDPYPTPGHPIGLSFATERSVRPIPRSLANIYRELFDDLGIPAAQHGDLTSWAENGVMLLNRVLSVRPGFPGSHRGKGWEEVTECAISSLVARKTPLVAILWGRDAAGVKPLLQNVPTLQSAHPSPLSASRGFFGSHPFSRANELLVAAGGTAINWSVS